ncbi:MAG: hypothetical protein K0R51_22 [Cytophagaceae bacterium]|jgi:hypothetical protein|nr:hypothetical protein [Cytophagaceae bacterium]
MYSIPLVNMLLFYGFFLIVSGIVSVIFIGMKAKTALISGGTAGGLVLGTASLILGGLAVAAYAGLALSFALFIVFSWRATKTLFRLFEMIPAGHEDLKGKGIAFLIISLMAVVSLVVFMIQIVFWNA